eukprot:TRINITY_DN12769_c0_g3_i2.p1 TRINITY_DN12769_c0_g3~~TRINITY_DN12769_c0_g3_i2.p1  ORF type:complete len:266 (-),score=60.03 TRINITY_DN12769_c0_g3_i2:201-971(-)
MEELILATSTCLVLLSHELAQCVEDVWRDSSHDFVVKGHVFEEKNNVTSQEREIAHIRANEQFNHFLETSSRLVEVIVAEKQLSQISKTVKSIQIGGVAGGDKFISSSILLKFSKDVELSRGKYIYVGNEKRDDFAMKAASHELMGAALYFDCLKGKIFPGLQTLIDFKEYRMVSMPIWPISKNTLVHGSCDAGKTVCDVDPTVRNALRSAAADLHLAVHEVRSVQLYTAGDIEVHKTKEGRFYLVDVAFDCSRIY